MDVKKLIEIVSISKNEIYIVIFYSFAIGLLSLALPIAAQGLVTIVSFGSLRQPLFVLTFAVFVLLTISGLFRLLQSILTEVFQQRLFATTSLKIAERLPKLQLKTLTDYHGTELLNRFFDIVTIQKSLADIMLNSTGIILQSILGLLLLAFYHPALLAFDFVYIVALSLVIILPFRKALMTAYDESDAKYEVVAWLEEMARVPYIFHFQGNSRYGIEKADRVTESYIKARQKHFRYILQHLSGTYIINVFSSTALLFVGGLLVLKNQMTLGQLVAAEIIVTSLGSSTVKMGRFLEKIYDLFAATNKVHSLLDLPVETENRKELKSLAIKSEFETAPEIEVTNLQISQNLNPISFHVSSKESLAFISNTPSGKSKLMQCVLGLRESLDGEIKFNNVPLKYHTISSFRKRVSYIHEIDIFDGTILENILVGRENIPLEKVIELINAVKLDHTINMLPQKLDSYIGGYQQPLSSVERMKIIFLRSYLSNPYLIAIDGALDIFSPEDLALIFSLIHSNERKWTLIATTRREDVANLFEKRIQL